MHPLRFAALAFLLVSLVTVGCTTGTDDPTDVSDPGFLPTGTYSLRVVAASCNVNGSFQSADRVALFRNAAGARPAVNIPMPTKPGGSDESVFGMPRQDVDLTIGHLQFDREGSDGCDAVTTSVDVTELSATRLGVTYRETPANCEVPACSVEYAFDLVEAACPRDCDSTGATLHAGAGGSMIWRCECR